MRSSSVVRATRPRPRRGLDPLGPPQNLVARYPEDVVSEVDVNGGRSLGDDLADNPLSVLEHHGLKFAGSKRRRCQRHETHHCDQTKDERPAKSHSPSIAGTLPSIIGLSSIVRIISILSTQPAYDYAPIATT